LVLRCLITFALSFAISYAIKLLLDQNVIGNLASCAMSLIVTFLFILGCGLTQDERIAILSILRKR
jgi:hypothetical protein